MPRSDRALGDPGVFRRYAFALICVAIATAVRLLLDPLLGTRFPFATVFFAVLAAAWYGGLGSAVVATLVGGVASAWFLLAPRHSLSMEGIDNQGGMALYLLVGLGISLIGGSMRRSRRQAEQFGDEADEQREKLQVTLGSIGDGVITTDELGKVTSLNGIAEQLTGWTTADAMGRPLDEVFHIINEDTRQLVVNPVTKVLVEGRIVGLANHTLLVARDGTERPIDDSAAPIRDADGNIIGTVLVFRDITERRHAEQELRRSEQLLSDFFDNANVGLHWVGPDGTILRANRAELELLGVTKEEFVGRSIRDFHADEETIETILDDLREGRSLTNRPARMRAKDGSIKEVLINSSVYTEHGKIVHTRCFTLDVTDRSRAHEAETLLAAVVRSSNDAIVTKTLAGVITSWNAGAERIFGYTPSDVVGKSIMLLIPEELQSEESLFQERLRRGERIENFETERLTRDGLRLQVSLTISPVCDPEGRVIGASKVLRDITDRKRADAALVESEERFRTMADNIAQIAWMADPHGNTTWYNRRWFEFCGWAPDAPGTWDRRQVHHPDHFDRVTAHLKRCWETGEPFEDVFPIRRHDGVFRWFLSRAVPIRDGEGKVLRWFGTNTDITEQREAEEALRQADQRKDEFLATLAHELRNPLAPVRSSLEIMRQADGDLNIIDQARLTIDRQMTHFERLVDDLLDVSRITRDKLELRKTRVELASVVHQAVEASRPLVEHMQHKLYVSLPETPLYLDADAVRLAQVLNNLLNNAAKYTEEGGQIWLDVAAEAGDVVISVKDTGRGIAPELLPSVFEMFTQLVRPVEPSHGGLGIGLTLVRRLVEMHGGSVEAFSEGVGKGSEFRVRLPLDQAAARAQQPAMPNVPVTTSGGKRILVVDDNRDAAQTLAMLLKISGHETRIATDGEAAIEAADAFRPQLAFLDIGLPKLSGHEVARRIRSEPWGQNICLVALTGWGQEEDRRKSSEAGFDHHLVKPVHHDELVKLLAALK
jgi:PAS domain S-box-containing protein